MRTLIVYYSLSGTTAEVAEALAKALDGEAAEILCDRYRSGIVSYLRAGYDSLKGRMPQIELPASVDQPSDLMIVAAPLWAGHLATPMRAFLAGNHKLPNKVGLVLTRGGSSPDTAFTEMEAHLPVPAKAKLTLTEKEVKAGTFTEPLNTFIAELNSADE